MRDTPGWYEDAVVYSLDPKTFADGNGDGVGDLAGLVDRLDYLSRLGVDCLWLLPIFPTPNRDNDYDVPDYYYHRFYHFQPDLNLANPDVREEIRQILSFWTQLGVAGFRIDAATLMIDEKGEGLVPERPHDVFREMKAAVRSRRPDGVLLAEADDEPEKLGEYFGDGD